VSTALYRRYRPENFAEVIGQDHVTAPLRQALRSGQVNHAYLFSGPRGCGKTTSARILARILNCAQNTEQTPTDTPCGVCPSCVELARGGPGSLDVVEIDAASHGGVDDARELRERATFAPARDRYKIFILDEAHMVSPQGFNALLKIVEEPPPHIKFVFATTEPDKVIGTIRSRTHHYPFRLVPPDVLVPYLDQLCATEGVPVGSGVLPLVVRAGGGSVRDTLSVLDQLIAGAGEGGLEYAGAADLLGYTQASLLDDLVEAIAARDGASAFRVVDRVISTGHEPRRFVEDLLERLRDLIVIAASGDAADAALRDVPSDQMASMRAQAGHLGAAELSRSADLANAALTEMTGATSPRLHLELLMARLLLPAVDDDRSGLGARLDRLERGLPAGSGAPVRSADAPGAEASADALERDDVSRAAPALRPESTRTAPAPRPESTRSAPAPRPESTRPAAARPESDVLASAPQVSAAAADAATPADATPADATPAPADQSSASATESTPSSEAAGASEPVEAAAPPAPVTPQAPAAEPMAEPERAAASHPSAEPGAAAEPESAAAPDVAAPEVAEPQPAAAPQSAAVAASSGGPDTEMLRRRWPEVLETIKGLRRVTWALVDPRNAQVADLDATTLRLSFDTAALAATFRNGGHPDVVARAVRETLGFDVRVEGVLKESVDRGGQGPSGQAPAIDAPARTAPATRSGAHDAEATRRAQASWDDVPPPAEPPADDADDPWMTAPQDEVPPAEEPASTAGPGTAGPGGSAASSGTGAPPWDTPAAPGSAQGSASAPASDERGAASPAPDPGAQSARERGVAAAAAAASARSRAVEIDDPSPDDPDITSSSLVGAPLIAQMLGGTVIDEQVDDPRG